MAENTGPTLLARLAQLMNENARLPDQIHVLETRARLNEGGLLALYAAANEKTWAGIDRINEQTNLKRAAQWLAPIDFVKAAPPVDEAQWTPGQRQAKAVVEAFEQLATWRVRLDTRS